MNDSKESRGEWVRQRRAELNWSQADLGRRVGVTGSAIGLFENSDKTGKNLSSEVWERIKRALGGGPAGEEIEFANVGFVGGSASLPKEIKLQMGVVSIWDCLLYTAFQDIGFVFGVTPEFERFDDWGHGPLHELQLGTRDALIHNYFLLEAAKRGRRQTSLVMTHPLFVFRGQFIFVSRRHLQHTIQTCSPDNVKARLQALAGETYRSFGDEIDFPRLEPGRGAEAVDQSALRALIEHARFAYAVGTDLELAVEQLHVIADVDATDRLLAFRGQPWMTMPSEAVLKLFEDGQVDILCGGLAYYWYFASRHSGALSDGITIIDPHELDIPSLNGIIAPLGSEGSEELDSLARAFYAGASLFANHLRTYKKDPISREFIRHTFRLIDLQLPNLFQIVSEDRDELEDAWVRARLMSQYVTFFKLPVEANKFVESKEFAVYRDRVVDLLGRSRQ